MAAALPTRKASVRGLSWIVAISREFVWHKACPSAGTTITEEDAMLSHNYSYEECLHNSLKVAWKEEDVLRNRDFDYSKRFLPNRLSGVDEITCLDEDEKRKLNQIVGNAYCHIFAFVEEFIIPQMLAEAQRDIFGDEARLRVLLRFAEEETKHQQMFRRSMALFEKGFGTTCGVIPAARRSRRSCSGSRGCARCCSPA